MYDFKAIVQCPKCGYKQTTTTVRTVTCFECGTNYLVLPILGKGKPKIRPRIIQVLKGDSWKKYYDEKKRREEKRRLDERVMGR